MAITVSQEIAQTINATHSDLVYVVTSNSSSNDNYSFNIDICDEDENLLQRFSQTPNLDGIGVFNINNYFDRDIIFPANDVFNTTKIVVNNQQFKRNQIRFSEQWSDGVSGDIKIYDGVDDSVLGNFLPGNVQADNLGDDPNNYFIPAVVNRNEQISPNFDSDDFYVQGTGTGTRFWLTDMPRTDIPVRKTDKMKLAAFVGQSYSGSGAYNDIMRVRMRQQSSDGTTLLTHYNSNTSNGQNPDSPRNSISDNFSEVSASYFQTDDWVNRFGFFGVAPDDINGYSDRATATQYVIDIQGYEDDQNVTTGIDVLSFVYQDDNCPYPIYRLCWLNKYGGLDWYNFKGRNRYNNQRRDENYRQGFIDYSISSAATNPYNVVNRGQKSFRTQQNQRIGISTDFLTQEWADWLEGLFVSPAVWLQDDTLDRMVPINLVSADYQKLNDPRTQKNKSYTIEFVYSNPNRPTNS